MLNKFRLTFIAVIFAAWATATYAASNASLWGSIDQPVPPIQQIEQQQQQLQAQQQAIANEQTVCEILTTQSTLSSDTANAAKIRDALTQAYKTALPDYKMFLLSTDAANTLYVKYRDLYIKTYCLAPSKQ